MPRHAELRKLAQARLDDAKVLFGAQRYDAAAYMCGYAVELALKACICRRLRLRDYPDAELKGAFKTHDFDDLALLAGLKETIDLGKNPTLFSNWSTAADWKPEWRYRSPGSTNNIDVENMLKALCDPSDGVLSWLKKRW